MEWELALPDKCLVGVRVGQVSGQGSNEDSWQRLRVAALFRQRLH